MIQLKHLRNVTHIKCRKNDFSPETHIIMCRIYSVIRHITGDFSLENSLKNSGPILQVRSTTRPHFLPDFKVSQ